MAKKKTIKKVKKEDKEKSKEKNIKFVKIEDLSNGMNNVNIIVQVDFVGNLDRELGMGDEKCVPAFVKDETGEIKFTFWGKDCKHAKEGTKVKVINGYITEFRGQLQLNSKKDHPIEIVK